jgi:mono/diheme cytochrome c family protein
MSGLTNTKYKFFLAGLLGAAVAGFVLAPVPPDTSYAAGTAGAGAIERGQYLTTISLCGDCHTPGHLLGQPDHSRHLAGTDVGFELPGLGYFYGPNLTPDPETGLGNWSEDEIVTALRTGVRPDGRILAPIMPWMSFASLSDEDAYAMAAYLKSLPAYRYEDEPPPAGADQTPPAPYMTVVFPDEHDH